MSAVADLVFPDRIDVFSGLGDVGVVDADALLHLLWSDAVCIDWSYGGQFAHLVEAAERTLQQFLRRNGKLLVVFFESGSWLWRSSPSRLLARRVLASHLQHAAIPLLSVHERSDSWRSDSWAQFLFAADPNWILGVDHTRVTDADEALYFASHSDWHARFHCRDVVLVNGIEYRGNDIRAWTVSRQPSPQALSDAAAPWDAQPAQPARANEALDAALPELLRIMETKCDAHAVAALRVSFAVAKAVPLASRFVSLEGPAHARDAATLAAIQAFAVLAMPHADASCVDLVDGRLVHHLARLGITDLAQVALPAAPTVATIATPVAASTTAAALPPPAAAPAAVPVTAAVESASSGGVAVSADAPVAESWEDWSTFDADKITLPAMDTAPVVAAAVAATAAPLVAVQPEPVMQAELEDDDAQVADVDVFPEPPCFNAVDRRERHHVLLGEPKKKPVVRTKQERKGEQRAAALEKLQANSLLGRYVQNHVITLDHKAAKQSKQKSKQVKIKTAAAAQEVARQESNWKDWLQKHDISETAAALSFVADNEFEEQLEHRILMEICERAKAMAPAMAVLAELSFRGCIHSERMAQVADTWGYNALAKQLRGQSTASDPRWIRHQLLETGDLLPREQGDADTRVKHFRPDAWQKQLLDYVDDGKSCVVVAPTSSGKTFIQYYVMEKVLRHDDNGVVVYVCPTKPLCNQVVAGVNARYEKTYPGGSTVLCGLFLPDRRHRADTCQILVTVPECLDILLLSPTKVGQAWARRLEWIIFDEVHTINHPEEGPVWERILQLTTCPFLALSATVGYPERFKKWLSETRKAPVELIVHEERYNDLRSFVAVSRDGAPPSLASLHPCTFVEVNQLAVDGFPSLADFEAKDTLELWEVMARVDAAAMSDVSPENYFRAPIISRQQSKAWARELKHRLVQWGRSWPDKAQRVVSHFADRLRPTDVFGTDSSSDDDAKKQGLFDLTQQLLKDGPVLLFCFVRSQTEDMVDYYAQKLAALQAAAAPDEKALKAREKERERQAKQKKRTAKQSKNKKDEEEAMREGESTEIMVLPVDEQYPVEFTLRRKDKTGLGKEDREDLIRSLKWKTKWPDDHPLIQGLRRGIGCHHEGLPHRYRVAVELMFRTGDLTVVFATQTLAQGIHAPARTVVLVRDSPTFLTPTSLRQMTGRAGRRGYDLLGQVVFYGISYSRIRQLLNSRVPQIRGGFPLSASLTQRLVSLQHSASATKEVVAGQVHQLLEQPLLSRNCEAPELAHLLRIYHEFYRNLLVDSGLLTAKGKPVWLGALASHLSYMDPANLMLLALLDRNVLIPYSNGIEASVPSTFEPLLLRLAAVLCPVEVHPTLEAAFRGAHSTNMASGVVAPVPQDVQQAVRAYNQLVLRHFVARTLGVTEMQAPVLPLTRKRIGGEDVALAAALKLAPAGHSPVSLFARTSGVVAESHFTTRDRVVNTVRNDLCVEHSTLPMVPELTHFNSFIVDFVRRLQVTNADVIRHDNHIHKAWYLLHDFHITLRVVATALNKMHSHHDNVMDANLYRMLAEDTDPIIHNDMSVADSPQIAAEKRLGNAIAVVSADFQARFAKLVN